MTRESEWLSDPKAMRALAHPARLLILNKLVSGVTATATEVAEIAGITPSAASYHLRMLAKYGFVEDAPPRGDGRERLWKAVDRSLAVGVLPDDQPDVRAAKNLLIKVFRDEANREAERALAHHAQESEEWREAIRFSRTIIRVDAAEMAGIYGEIEKLLEPYIARYRDERSAPLGARVAEAQVSLFPHVARTPPGIPTEDHDRPG
ncbi:winged helix-turn-helix transcriptional regulator [Nonomuraea sp. NN258]|uniref:ArsR/SmtB family transcription factor n=1 Tax=Nonomuraea antri TaxID=2730852 RepID=UPI001569A1E1|nr:winged helix-turn-helix domain-containing protein [Nonomuraea antri]NRQ40128.1 winged helix-turn-helix transcriptional regulator [Nonomuraea antri]